jgi:uncharacterized protein YodC (DUF2158 family)
MKTLAIFLFLGILSAPKNAIKIMVTGVSMETMGDSLRSRGFEIQSSSLDSIVTKYKEYYVKKTASKKVIALISIKVKRSGDGLEVSAKYQYDETHLQAFVIGMGHGDPAMVVNEYTKGSYMHRAFDYMDDFARSFGKETTYLTK